MNEKIYKIINHPNRVPVLVGVVSFSAGVGTGFFLGRKNKGRITHVIPPKNLVLDSERLEEFIEQREKELDIETDSVVVPGNMIDPVKVGETFIAEHIKDAMTSHHGDELVVVSTNIFADNDDTWNFEEELKKRNSSTPYILHKDEFYENGSDFPQITLTYYAGDNILADEENTPVYNIDVVIGELLFGHGSGDPKIFYVRNETRRAEYEIVHDVGYYSVEVLGLDMENEESAEEIKHSRNTKFRLD